MPRAPDVICCRKVKIGTSVGFITPRGPVYRINGEDSERSYTFEWHPMWGPSRCHSVTGELLKNPFFPERSPFWNLFGRWMAGGKQVDDFGRCILGPKEQPCGPCAGKGYSKFPGDTRKHACPECSGYGKFFPPLAVHEHSVTTTGASQGESNG